jgi:hypothetical protein
MVSMDVFINRSKKRYTTKVLFSQASMTVADFGYHVETFLIYLPFPYFDIERTWWRSFQKRVVCSKFDIYVFI